jgi:hypothetical protein
MTFVKILALSAMMNEPPLHITLRVFVSHHSILASSSFLLFFLSSLLLSSSFFLLLLVNLVSNNVYLL